MKKIIYFIFRIQMLILILLGFFNSAQAITFTVNTTKDELNFEKCKPETPANCSFRTALVWANQIVGMDTIILPAGIFPITLLGDETKINPELRNDFDISDSVIIKGSGKDKTIIDGMDHYRLFELIDDVRKNQYVEFDDLTMRRGKIMPGQPGLACCGGAIEAFSEISSNKNGDEDSLVLRRVHITDNEIDGFGKAGSAIYSQSENILIEDSEIDNNNHILPADKGSAGALMNLSLTKNLIIERTRFHDNLMGPGTGGCMIFFTAVKNLWWNQNELSNSDGEKQICIPPTEEGQRYFVNSTFSGNAGAIFSNSGKTGLFHVTMTNNNVEGLEDRIIWNAGIGELWIKNSIIANAENAVNCDPDFINKVHSLGNNISDDDSCVLTDPTDQANTDPLLGPLANNGGPTLTHLPLAGSPAIDNGELLENVKIDQRGFKRPQGFGVDIGAVEKTPILK